jgi:hypothetical protein
MHSLVRITCAVHPPQSPRWSGSSAPHSGSGRPAWRTAERQQRGKAEGQGNKAAERAMHGAGAAVHLGSLHALGQVAVAVAQ